ncbi:hypothetical protein SEA_SCOOBYDOOBYDOO_68 [Mycobacterium phage ScoobyDoobyDoo]|nr:hypothetical protein SEA_SCOOBYDOOBYDOO_68 [Mycobacterium phage ScoobyDoobyDoo]
MFKNAERDPLAIPQPVQRRSVGPTRRQAAYTLDPSIDESGGWDYANGPDPAYADGVDHFLNRSGIPTSDPEGIARATEQAEGRYEASLPPKIASALDAQAREFLARDHGCDDRSELLYRAERHARTQTSTWTPHASERATQAFVSKVAELIPSRSNRVAAAQTSAVEDFDDQLLY